jgi:hypothetical protein
MTPNQMKSTDKIRTTLRLLPDVHHRVQESARKNKRSFQAEIEMRVEQSFFMEDTNTAHHAVQLSDNLS